MSLDKLAMVDRLAQADGAAKTIPHEDIISLMTPSPAHQPEVFVVPVRYALGEEKAPHACVTSGVATQSHPMAARRLRTGFLYLWQEKGPLKRYAIATNGLLCEQELEAGCTVVQEGMAAGLALKKNHDAWMLYCEFPLKSEHCKSLSASNAKRSAYMRHVALRMVANEWQAPHCPPLAHADQVLGELIPAVYTRSMKVDQKQAHDDTGSLSATAMQAPSTDNINASTEAMYCTRERVKVKGRHPETREGAPGEWSSEWWDRQRTQDWLDTASAQAKGLFPVFVCLDDDLGVLRDINHEQESVEARHEQWVGANNLRLSIGGFVRSLISERKADLAGTLIYRYKGHQISLTPEQREVMLNAHHQLDEELPQYRGQLTQAEAAARAARIADIVSPVRGFIPSNLYNELELVVREYLNENKDNLSSQHFSTKVGECIDLDAMNTWLDNTAAGHYQQIEQRHATLFADRGQYLKRSISGTWFVDYHDLDTRLWLTELATGCLTAQCIRAQGAEQYADYVRAVDGGALTQLFRVWTPSIDAAVNSMSRRNELMAALASNDLCATYQAMAPLNATVLRDIAAMARDTNSGWSTLVNRLAAALLLLNDNEFFSSAWLGVFVAARLGSDTRLQLVTEGNQEIWRLQGQKAEGLAEWVRATSHAIGIGQVKGILKSPLVPSSAGVVPLAALLLNTFNASNYLSPVGGLEGMNRQRNNEAVSAALYDAAALTAVIDNQVRLGLGIKEIGKGTAIAPTLTLFGGVIGGLSAGTEYQELRSLQSEMENAQTDIDPWLNMHQSAVGGQLAAYGAQALLGGTYTMRVLSGLKRGEVAIMSYSLCMGPRNWIVTVLGAPHRITRFFQQSPQLNFLNHCCWSKTRAGKQTPIAAKAQHDELNQLFGLLYTPRISMDSHSVKGRSTALYGPVFESVINALTIDLPGAEPTNAYLELSLIGDPVDTLADSDLIKNFRFGNDQPPRPWRDMTSHWLLSSRCCWIPAMEGRGLRLSGPVNALPLSLPPRNVSLRLRYRTPLIAMLGARNFIGGARGVTFTLSDHMGVIALLDDPTPQLDRVPSYPLGQPCLTDIYLRAKDSE